MTNTNGIAAILNANPGKYVVLDLSNSTSLSAIGGGAFYNCSTITGIIIPANVTSIGMDAFANCGNLTSVTFKGNIEYSKFDQQSSSPGAYLRMAFYEYNQANGTPGTYTRSSGGTIWTRTQ
ncbi:MAG: leucine-rich repeat domain-containing protein [Treponema sp.]|nr:leucine-rich repeat domain-containing protein [Treponema sp.]